MKYSSDESSVNALIRVDASVELGTGHVMRCLTLADALRASGISVAFACQALPGNLCDFIASKGYHVGRLVPAAGWQRDVEQTAATIADRSCDWIIVDHYGLDGRWETAMRPYAKRIMAIDDLADRPHRCDVLLDQNYYKAMGSRYDGLVSADCLKLLGPRYALLRPEFREARRLPRAHDGSVRKILVFFGSADARNVTAKAIQALALIKANDVAIDVVIGVINPHRETIERLCREQSNMRLHVQATNMAELMIEADLCIGAGGATMLERCLLGLPTLTVVFAENQEQSTRDIAELGALRYLGWADDLTVEALADAIADAISHPADVAAMSRRAEQIMDGFAVNGKLPVVSALLDRSTVSNLRTAPSE